MLGQERTWTGRQLATVLAERGIALSARQVRRYLEMMGAGWRQTTNSLRHQQDPAKVAQAVRVLGHLKEKASAGRLKLCYLDEFVACYHPDNRHDRKSTWTETNPDGRWRSFTYDELASATS